MTNEDAINCLIKTCADTNKISDGYHTFSELYDHRIKLFIALCKALVNDPQYQQGQKSEVWKSRKHSDGHEWDGWFIMGIGSSIGEQITYHLPMFEWSNCEDINTLDKAPDYDGHTSEDALDRISKLFN